MKEVSRYKALIKASFVAIAADVFLILLKYSLSLLTNSAVFKADALHSLGDLSVSLTVLFSIVVKNIFKDKSPARYIEMTVSFLISLFLMAGSLFVIYESLFVKVTNYKLTPGFPVIFAFIAVGIACAVTLGVSLYKSGIGEKYHSIVFTAEGRHTYSDFFTSLSVWITLLLGYLGIHVERITALVMGIIVLQIGIKLASDILNMYGIRKLLKHPAVVCVAERIKPVIRVLKVPYPEPGWFIANKKKLIRINAAIVLMMYAGLGFYTVLPYQTGIELLFGKVVELNSPGLHYHMPAPFGYSVNVNTEVSIRLESGYRTNWAKNVKEPDIYLWELSKADGRFIKNFDESISLTGDENLLDGNFLCYYRITDPVYYALDCRDARELLRSLFTHEVHAVLGEYPLEPILTSLRGSIQEELAANMKHAVSELYLGVEILNVYMQEVHPPVEVVSAYRSVASAREKKDETIHRANAYANSLIPKSEGEGIKLKEEAEAYAYGRKESAAGEAEAFRLKDKVFSRFADVQKVSLWWEKIEALLKDKKIYLFPAKSKRRFFLSDKSTHAAEPITTEENSQ